MRDPPERLPIFYLEKGAVVLVFAFVCHKFFWVGLGRFWLTAGLQEPAMLFWQVVGVGYGGELAAVVMCLGCFCHRESNKGTAINCFCPLFFCCSK